MCEKSSNSIFAPLTVLRIHLSLVVSFHLLKQEAIFPALKISFDAFNDFLMLNTCVSNVVSVGHCSFGFDATNCSVFSYFDMDAFGCVGASAFLLELSGLSIKETDSCFGCLGLQILHCMMNMVS